jgi:hypothetical protein
MKFTFKKLGLLDEAEIELADLTIICGENNTGKTYATYAIYGFLRAWRDLLREVIFEDIKDTIKIKINNKFDLAEMFSGKLNKFLSKISNTYKEKLHEVFATGSKTFHDCEFTVSTNDNNIDFYKRSYQNRIQDSAGNVVMTITKQSESNVLELLFTNDQLFPKNNPDQSFFVSGLEFFIADCITEIAFAPELPRAHISSAERTGASIFRKELDFARTRMLKALNETDSKTLKDPFTLLKHVGTDYAWPVEDNVEFLRLLEDIDKQTSELSKEHPEILTAFDNVIGGTYKVDKNTGLFYQSKGGRKQRFTMNESSSCVRALVDVDFYLRGKAKPGDLFIIDEPELNLHPKNQRAFARLIARLINAGIKVFITTQSDYLVKEFNTLIMLNQKTEHTRKVQGKYKYDDSELLDHSRVRLYMAARRKPSTEKGKRSSTINTLIPANIDPQYGIEVETFDKTIDEMNNIQEDILYGVSSGEFSDAL